MLFASRTKKKMENKKIRRKNKRDKGNEYKSTKTAEREMEDTTEGI